MQRPDSASSASPRPSSHGSMQSMHSMGSSDGVQDHGPKPWQDVCIGEEVKTAIHLAIERFRMNESQKELEFPSSLTATERAYIHRYSEANGLKHCSKGKGSARFLTLSKKESSLGAQSTAIVHLARNSRQHIVSLLQRYPLSNKERQELVPRLDKNQSSDVSRELNKTTIGKLNNGVAQVPPPRGNSDLNSFREGLPVHQHREQILQTISNNRVSLVSGETGSGKTTQVPQMILDEYCSKGLPCRILCTQPRRIAALSIAERVSAERGEKVGQTVGYQIRLESKVSPKTLLTFCTNGVLLRTLMGGDAALSTVTHIIADEVHERDRFCDFLLASMKDVLAKYQHIHLILMSASLNTELFVRFFNNCPVVEVPGSLFAVQEYFLEDVLKWTGYTNKVMDKLQKEKGKVAKQQEQLEEWCAKMSLEDGTDSQKKSSPETDEGCSLEENDGLGQEKEELEPWVIKEMDKLLGEVWLNGDEDTFSQIFHLILSENVSVDYQHSETSATPLMIATGRGFADVVEQLLNLGANVGVHASNGWTAIDWAKRFNRIDILEMLEATMLTSELGPAGDNVVEVVDKTMSEEDKEILHFYQHSFDDDKVDVNLIVSLLYKLMLDYKEGAVLIFLPGYDEIVTIREKIAEDKFFENYRYLLYTLHSSMQSSDQKRVFRAPPPGIRKIILATNIAETSITIDDVVFVIDAGKVKEKTFDALLSVTMLKSIWISKASALQRKGRAGRCQPGYCYHLFSRQRYNTLMDFPAPEILRYPLQELCLHTKLLAPSTCSIADYLAKCPEPPTFLLTRNAVHLLKQIDALDACEDLTELGHHLADMPVEPCLGKMVLYSVVLKCLDPILTIVCALAYKDPFLLPTLPYQKREANMCRRKFAADTFSDHMTLLRAFQAWQRARTDGWEKSFCDKNFLSSACLEMIVGMRTQLLGQLRASGFVRARGGGDIRDLNTNSENWAVVKAALCAGSYPNLLRVDRQKKQLFTQKEQKVRFHMSSVLSPAPGSATKKSYPKQIINDLRSDWIIYQEMTRFQQYPMVRTSTVVSAITLAIFAGPAKLPADALKNAHQDRYGRLEGYGDSDSEEEEKEDIRDTTLKLDDWLSFKFDFETANLVLTLRQKWNCLFLRRMRSPSKAWSQVDEAVIRAVVQVLTNEEQSLGLQQPAGIGQRPRPMTAESIMACIGGRGNYESEDYYNDTHNYRGGRRTMATPPRKGTQFQPRSSRGGYDRSETPSTTSSSNSPSGTSSLRGSSNSTPCTSPQPSVAPQARGDTADAYHSRFFVMKCSNQKSLDESQTKGYWATSDTNARKLNKYFEDGKVVYLIFSVQGSGHFQGYAKMTSKMAHENSQEHTQPNLSSSCQIEWIRRANMPFQNTHSLLNPWNDNKRVQISRDGTEVEPSVGETLVSLWERPLQGKASSSDNRPYNKQWSPSQSSKTDNQAKQSPNKGQRASGAASNYSPKYGGHRDMQNFSPQGAGGYPGLGQQQGPGSYPYPSQGHPFLQGQTDRYQGYGANQYGNQGMNYNQSYNHGYQGNSSTGSSSPGGQGHSPVMILQRGHQNYGRQGQNRGYYNRQQSNKNR